MKRWAVTGPMGAGKSTLTRLLAARGAAVIDGDELGHRILAREGIRERIAAEFGSEVIRDGRVDRRALGRLVFADPAELARLNAITHGPLAELAEAELQRVAAEGRHFLAVLDAAVYFLLPQPPPMDLVIAVVAAADRRRDRMVRRTGLGDDEVAQRLSAQEPMDALWRHADLVLSNDGPPEELATVVAGLWAQHFPDPCG